MKSPFADEYWKAAVKEIETLEKMGVWDVVDHPEGVNVIDSTWAFKLKCYPAQQEIQGMLFWLR